MTFSGPILIDSDVLIDLLKSYPPAVAFMEKLPLRPLISVMTAIELWAGVRHKKEEVALIKLLAGVEQIEVTFPIAEKAARYRRIHGRSHGTGAVDAVIAASAEMENARLVTLNEKHYPMAQNLLVPYRKTA